MNIVIFGFICRDKNVLPSGGVSEIVGGKGLFDGAAAVRAGAEVHIVTWLPEEDHDLLQSLDEYPVTIHIIPMETGTVNTNTHEGDTTIATTTLDPRPVRLDDLTPVIREAMEGAGAILFAPDIEEKISIEVLRYASSLQARIFADVGKYFRILQRNGVLTARWPWPKQAEYLEQFDTIFLSEEDVEIPLQQGGSLLSLAREMSELGPREIVITQGSRGSFIFQADTNEGIEIAAYKPREIVDPTGAGDTFISAYIVRRVESDNAYDAGKFGAMAASLKLNYPGPLRESAEEIDREIHEREENKS